MDTLTIALTAGQASKQATEAAEIRSREVRRIENIKAKGMTAEGGAEQVGVVGDAAPVGAAHRAEADVEVGRLRVELKKATEDLKKATGEIDRLKEMLEEANARCEQAIAHCEEARRAEREAFEEERKRLAIAAADADGDGVLSLEEARDHLIQAHRV